MNECEFSMRWEVPEFFPDDALFAFPEEGQRSNAEHVLAEARLPNQIRRSEWFSKIRQK
jgi:hypothetical protein